MTDVDVDTGVITFINIPVVMNVDLHLSKVLNEVGHRHRRSDTDGDRCSSSLRLVVDTGIDTDEVVMPIVMHIMKYAAIVITLVTVVVMSILVIVFIIVI